MKKLDYGQILMWSAVVVSAPRWAGAMLAADLSHVTGVVSSVLNIGNVISGLGMGLLEVVAIAYMLDAIRTMKSGSVVKGISKPNFKFWGVLFFVVGTMIVTPIVLAPYLVSRMVAQDIGTTLSAPIWMYVWAVAVIIAPLFVVGGVAFARPGMIDNKVVASDATTEQYVCEECGFTASNKWALFGHMKKHSNEKKEPAVKLRSVTPNIEDDNKRTLTPLF